MNLFILAVTVLLTSTALAFMDIGVSRLGERLYVRRGGQGVYFEKRWESFGLNFVLIDLPVAGLAMLLKTHPWFGAYSALALIPIAVGRYQTGVGLETRDSVMASLGRGLSLIPQFVAFILPLMGVLYRLLGGRISK